MFFRPGAELELFYTPPINIQKDNGSAMEVNALILNGRFGSRQQVFAMRLERQNFKGLDSDIFQDATAVRLGTESMRARLTTYGIYLGYRDAIFKNKIAASPLTISHVSLESFFAQEFTTKGKLGLHLAYVHGLQNKSTVDTFNQPVKRTTTGSSFRIGIDGDVVF